MFAASNGMTMVKNVRVLLAPSVSAASSKLTCVCCKPAKTALVVNGSLLTEYENMSKSPGLMKGSIDVLEKTKGSIDVLEKTVPKNNK